MFLFHFQLPVPAVVCRSTQCIVRIWEASMCNISHCEVQCVYGDGGVLLTKVNIHKNIL